MYAIVGWLDKCYQTHCTFVVVSREIFCWGGFVSRCLPRPAQCTSLCPLKSGTHYPCIRAVYTGSVYRALVTPMTMSLASVIVRRRRTATWPQYAITATHIDLQWAFRRADSDNKTYSGGRHRRHCARRRWVMSPSVCVYEYYSTYVGRGAMFCDELRLMVSVSLFASKLHEPYKSKLHWVFCACRRWPWLVLLGGVAIFHVFPVLWITSCFPI